MGSLKLGAIGNCQIAALLDERARFAWTCLPQFDSDPRFCGLLSPAADKSGQQTGIYEIELEGFARSEQRYVPNTPILETTLYDNDGNAVRITDFAPRYSLHGRLYRPVMMIRSLVPVAGWPRIRVRLRPACGYGTGNAEITYGSNHIRYVMPDLTLRLTTDVSLTAIMEEGVFILNEAKHLILGPDETIPDSVGSVVREQFGQTRSYWEAWVRGLAIPFEWQEAVIRAAITLKLCTFEDTGAVIAAMTTSIPEAADSGRNWDYRFCWLRDSYFVVKALNSLGATKTMEAYLRYIMNVSFEAGDQLQPVYSITGNADLTETTVDSLLGYRGMGPVRVGNQAYQQIQNDVYGAVVLAATRYFFDSRLSGNGNPASFDKVEALARKAAEAYDQPDAGIWEYRGRKRIHTFSSVMCWAACDRLARISGYLGKTEQAEEWRGIAARMHTDIAERAWDSQQQAFTESFGNPELDASLLTMPDLGFVKPDDPRFTGTLKAIEGQLRDGNHLMRYRAADDFGEPENAFNICTFWYIDALAATGRIDEARELFEHMLSCRNDLGLLSEDTDPINNELWGNFPQTYSMVGIINSARLLSRSWESAA